ncbi:hypothetical protein U8527_13175 [Kordia algicida OT-1]|uniref:Uncharacterized protein n=1 Tax=Kordia algicida OT-1 TaxID=391587 RepID=A9E5B7_9FLAO|nr:hypothetical protein [Kordia algicida]EDP95161.1 hypothetical protein KAOT1_06747 [Kordia algicida OT-1]
MSNSNQDVLNSIIKNMLPKINSEIQGTIKSNHLDPWGQIAHRVNSPGNINLGICHARVETNFNIINMVGLSSFHIDQLQITAAHQGANPNELVGTVAMTASLTSNLSAHIGGEFQARCEYLHRSTGINGSANVTAVKAQSTGSFTASIDGEKVCLEAIMLSPPVINYGNVNVHVGGLGAFSEFTVPLEEMTMAIFKGQVREAISSAVSPIINQTLKTIVPQCQNV